MSRPNKARVAARGQAGQGHRGKAPVSAPAWRRIPFWAYVLGLVAVAAGISLPLYLAQRGSTQSASSLNSPTPLSVASVGKLAPRFVLSDPYGQTYALTPGDGRARVLVFYMGYF